MRLLISALAALLLAAPALSASPANLDWPHYGGQHDEAGHAALDQINRQTVRRLGLA